MLNWMQKQKFFTVSPFVGNPVVEWLKNVYMYQGIQV